jgi:hypothetical protein
MKSFIKSLSFIPAILAIAAMYAGCNKGPEINEYIYPAPQPEKMFPDTGYAGFADVSITGASFGDYKNVVKVFFGGIQADTVLSCEDGKIVVRVPANAISGKVSLQVWTHTIDSIGEFTVVSTPVVKSASKDIGLPGETVTIAGTGFGTDLTKVTVSFNGTTGTISNITDTSLNVILPQGFTSGNIVVYVNNYPAPGPGFRAVATVPDPIYWLPFEGDLTDKMGGAAAIYTYKDSGKPMTFSNGRSGQAVKFEGTYNFITKDNQILSLPQNITRQKELTVACWVNWTNDSTQWFQEPIFDAGLARGTRLCLMTRMNSGFGTGYQNMIGRMAFENINGYGTPPKYFNAIGNAPLKPKEWHHVAMVVSQANHIEKIYMDGTEIGSVALDPQADHTTYNHTKVYIGAPTNGVVKEPALGGMIDEFQIFNQALNADQVYALYYKNKQ